MLGRKAMINPDSMLKNRVITLPTKVCLVKAVVFPVVMYGCESWTIKKAAATVKSLQSCPTLCDPIDGSLPGSSIPGIFQARTLLLYEQLILQSYHLDSYYFFIIINHNYRKLKCFFRFLCILAVNFVMVIQVSASHLDLCKNFLFLALQIIRLQCTNSV